MGVGSKNASVFLRRRTLPKELAERVGFEPTVPLRARQFSRLFPSTTRTSLRKKRFVRNKWRRERDLNPRGSLRPPNDLANRPLQPLGYLSATETDYNRDNVDCHL